MATTGKAPRHLTRTPHERLLEKTKISSSGCWEWTGSLTNKGYGDFHFCGKTFTAHKASWIIHNGEIPIHKSYHGLCVCHKCDNRKCVNPDHLFLGTNRDNIIDCMNKGRNTKKIFKQDVYLMKALRILGCTYDRIAKKMGIPRGTITGTLHRCQ